jgi:YVTN family beta-propeller protein
MLRGTFVLLAIGLLGVWYLTQQCWGFSLPSPACQSGVDVGNGPVAATFDDRLNRTFVANTYSNTVSVIGLNDRTIATIDVGIAPVDLTYDHDTNLVYVANSGSDSVSVIDPITNRVLYNLPVGSVPVALSGNLQSEMGLIYVANWRSNTVTAIQHNIQYGYPITNISGFLRIHTNIGGFSGLPITNIFGFSGPRAVVSAPQGGLDHVYVLNSNGSISTFSSNGSAFKREPEVNFTMAPNSGTLDVLPPYSVIAVNMLANVFPYCFAYAIAGQV